METNMSDDQTSEPTPEATAPQFRCEYCFNGDWDGFRIRSLRPMPNIVARLFARFFLNVSYRKFLA
jgi:hypothetical protein